MEIYDAMHDIIEKKGLYSKKYIGRKYVDILCMFDQLEIYNTMVRGYYRQIKDMSEKPRYQECLRWMRDILDAKIYMSVAVIYATRPGVNATYKEIVVQDNGLFDMVYIYSSFLYEKTLIKRKIYKQLLMSILKLPIEIVGIIYDFIPKATPKYICGFLDNKKYILDSCEL